MLSQAELAARAGISESTVRSIEASRRDNYSGRVLRELSRALGWSPLSISRIFDGGEPEVIEAAAEPDLRAEIARLSGEIAELRSIVERLTDRG